MTGTRRGNLFSAVPRRSSDEEFLALVQTEDVLIERIVSTGQTTPEGDWYDQERDEWVLVVQGQARLRLEASGEVVDLNAGDWIHLPAHCRHRVDWTDPDQPTVWLAVHFRA